MDNPPYILETPLPVSQDFTALKGMGLSFLQQFGGSQWTNFNQADPGVTILDQVCYALTELGYSNGFPIEDILTEKDGTLKIAGQFYLPEEILTTSPVTLLDYQRYLVDGVAGIMNAILVPVKGKQVNSYAVYIQISDSTQDEKDICNAAHIYLSKTRNLGETFIKPVRQLIPITYFITGELAIDAHSNAESVLSKATGIIQDYILPPLFQKDFNSPNNRPNNFDDQFNGPGLQKGLASGARRAGLKTAVMVTEIAGLLLTVPGILAASVENFFKEQPLSPTEDVSCREGELLSIDLIGSITKGTLKLTKRAVPINTGNVALSYNSIEYGPGLEQTPLPKGKWRDVDNYYSIQNTFPEVFGVGANTPEHGINKLQKAHSRQLKGYLSLFDQVLANQFAQLANVDSLLSFKNVLTGTPTDEKTYYAGQDEFERQNPLYPVPFLGFSPTYFYQSLYEVPHIKPLLKHHDTFKFSDAPMDDRDLEKRSWKAYKEDPYNSYIKGLMDIMEHQATRLQRRNDILDHLLARHGESPAVLDALFETAPYTGQTMKDKVIRKSLYLQNLGLLSYYRHKAFNYTAAKEILPALPIIQQGLPNTVNENSSDFIFDMHQNDLEEKVTENDITNYSTLELKLFLLFGLRPTYNNFITSDNSKKSDQEMGIAFWMMTQRRGMVLIETGLVSQHLEASNSFNADYDALIILPDFVPPFNTPQFNVSLDTFLEYNLPAHFTCKYVYYNAAALAEFIPTYTTWYNSIIGIDKATDVIIQANAFALAELLIKNDESSKN